MALHPLRERIRRDFMLGMFVSIPSPALIESLRDTDFDVLVIDAEHGAFGVAQIDEAMRAADVIGMPALVRVPELGSSIAQSLDAGAAGVIVPRIDTVEQAKEVVDRVRYAPLGRRGAGPGRASGYGVNLLNSVAKANDHLLAIVQIETRCGLEAVEQIAALPGLDALCIGPFDLSVSIGKPIGSAEHDAAMKRIYAAAAAAGIAVIPVCFSAGQIAPARGAGATMVIFGQDRGFLLQALAEASALARKEIQP